MKMTPTMGGAYSGSFGGITFSHNKGGQYCRRRSIPTDPQSSAQLLVRNAVANLSNYWVNTLTPAERASWDLYAQNVSWVDTLGQTIQLTGLNHFVRSNSVRNYVTDLVGQAFANFAGTLPVIEPAPAIFDLGVPFAAENPSLVLAAGVATLSVTNATNPVPAGTGVLYMFASPPVNPSVTFFKGPFLCVGSASASADVAAILSSAAETPYFARYGALTIGQKVFWRARLQIADGRLSTQTVGSVLVT